MITVNIRFSSEGGGAIVCLHCSNRCLPEKMCRRMSVCAACGGKQSESNWRLLIYNTTEQCTAQYNIELSSCWVCFLESSKYSSQAMIECLTNCTHIPSEDSVLTIAAFTRLWSTLCITFQWMRKTSLNDSKSFLKSVSFF